MYMLQEYKSGILSGNQPGLLRFFYVLLKSNIKPWHDECCLIVNRMLSLLIINLIDIFGADIAGEGVEKQQYIKQVRVLKAIFIALSTLCALFLLYVFRGYDDNRLMSWQWVFVDNVIYMTGLLVSLGVFLSWWLSGIQLSIKATLAILLCLSFIICSTLWSQPELIVDASRYFIQAKSLAEKGPVYFAQDWGNGITAWTDLPLIPFIYGLLFKWVGEYRIAIQILTTIFFCGTVLLTFLIGKELWNEVTGLYGGALLLGMPFLLTQVPLMLVDIPTMFFLSFAIYCMIRAVKTNTLTWVLSAGFTIILALLSKYSTWLMLSVLPIVAVSCRSGGWRDLATTSLYVFVLVGSILAVLVALKFQVVAQQFFLLINYQMPGLARWYESHISTFLFQVHPFITFAALSSVYFAWSKRDIRYLVVSWMMFLVLILEIKRIRYMIIVFPMFSLMAAYALMHIKDFRIRNYIVFCIVVFSSIVTLFSYSLFTHSTSAMNIKHAGEYLNKTNSPVVEVVLLPQSSSTINPFVSLPLLDLFTGKRLVYSEDSGVSSRPDREKIKTSPLRFSWEYNLKDYYESSGELAGNIIVVISENDTYVLPEKIRKRSNNYYLKRRFVCFEDIFRYSTIADVYVVGRQQSFIESI